MNKLIEIINGELRQVQYSLPSPLNIEICRGEQISIIGPNGSGKSVIVGALTGAIPLKGSGTKYYFEQKASQEIKHLAFRDSYGTGDRGYYHQQRWNSCDRDEQPLVSDVLPDSDNKQLKSALYKLFNFESMLKKQLILLSSGELRKFQLIKALLSDPKILILEDPFIGLDANARCQLSELLEELTRTTSLQVILVVSKQRDIPTFISHVIAVENGTCSQKVDRATYLESNKTESYSQVLSKEEHNRILDLRATPSTHTSDSIIQLNRISIKYDQYTILKDLSWSVKRGEQWALSGENGAGKSTLLSLICADIPQGYACDLKLFNRKRGSGESIWDIKRHIGYVSPEMHRAYCTSAPCIEIVASGLHDTVGLYRRMKEHESEICEFWMDVFGVGALRDRDFMRISSGEQRLILLARAFVKDPELLILDEPLHGLDERNRRRTLDIVETFCRRKDKSLIYVSHYKEELPRTITNSLHLQKVK